MRSRGVNPECRQKRRRTACLAVAGLAVLIAAGNDAGARSGRSERPIESIQSRSAGVLPFRRRLPFRHPCHQERIRDRQYDRPDEIFIRNITDPSSRRIFPKAAIERVVAIITQHEVVVRRNDIFVRIVGGTVWIAIIDDIGATVRQRFTKVIASHSFNTLNALDGRERQCNSIQIDDTSTQLNAIPWQTNQALHVIGLIVARQLEDNDIATLGFTSQRPIFFSELDQPHARTSNWLAE